MNILVSGCSFTKGHGLLLENHDPKLWVNQIAKKLECNSLDNIAEHGYNNQTIFLETLNQMSQYNYDLIIVAWSTMPRWNFTLGFELYKTFSHLGPMKINTNTRIFTERWQDKLKKHILEGHNDHWHLLKLVKYVNILINYQKVLKKQKIFFVNTYGPWPLNFYNKKDLKFPSDLTTYEQNILNVDTRDDDEIFELYNLMHQHYSDNGGIHEYHWLNLYNSFKELKVDNASESDKHPGYASQDVFVEQLWSALEEKLK